MPLSNRYERGQWKAVCDRCGMDFLSSQLKLEPRTKYRVCSKCWDPFPPQERPVRARERGPLPWVRPEGEDHFVPTGWCLRASDGSLWRPRRTVGGDLATDPAVFPYGRIFDYVTMIDVTGAYWRLTVDTAGVPNTDPSLADALAVSWLLVVRIEDGTGHQLGVDTDGAWTLEDYSPVEIP